MGPGRKNRPKAGAATEGEVEALMGTAEKRARRSTPAARPRLPVPIAVMPLTPAPRPKVKEARKRSKQPGATGLGSGLNRRASPARVGACLSARPAACLHHLTR